MGTRRSFLAIALVAVFAGTSAATPSSAAPKRAPTNITISSNGDFDAAHGVVSGSGSHHDPYVFSGLDIQRLQIENTNKYIEIKKSSIAGQLVLDWVGDRVKVHYNRIGDLRVNRNVKRTGLPTSGTIAHNTFGVVGQLRHWDGHFMYNRVGTTSALSTRAVNFDGFNGAHFAHNTIYGFMDARLHGHHHSSGFGEESHMHAGHSKHAVDHGHRYHQVLIDHNSIYSEHTYALAYLDTNHAGNDRTAPSETETELNDPHVHYTRMAIASNRLVGAGILVDVFNALDPHHPKTGNGSALIRWNRVALGRDAVLSGRNNLHGVEVRNARDVKLTIEGNVIRGYDTDSGFFGFLETWDNDAGIFIHNVDDAIVYIKRNRVENRTYGVRAESFTKAVLWRVDYLVTRNVDDAVYYKNVPNKPS